VDGIWITVMFANGENLPDKLAENLVKQGRRVPILAAGVWPATGRTRLIA
jgi:hypothetical protein